MKKYFFDNKLDIILYGVNVYSQQLACELKENGFHVCAYIDRRASELIRVGNIDVYRIEMICDYVDLENACVIIMLQNALQHDEIAATLYCKGFLKIIFVPMAQNYIEEIANEFRRIYNLVLLKQLNNISTVPYYSELVDIGIEHDIKVYDETEDYVIIRAACDIIYTNPAYAVKNNPDLLKYADIPIAGYKPYNEMFEYLQGEREQLNEYLQDYGVNSCHYRNSYLNSDIICQRGKLYEIWNEHFQQGLDFFIASAPEAKWNEKGYFNLLEGQHRTLFLIKKGIYYVPIRVLKSDCRRMHKGKKVQKISVISTMTAIQQKVERNVYVEKNVLDASDLPGYFGMNLYRMGAKSIAIYSANLEKDAVCEEICDSDLIKQAVSWKHQLDWEKINQYEVILLIGESEQIKKYKRAILPKLNQMDAESILFSATGEEYMLISHTDREKMTLITKFFGETDMNSLYLYVKDARR